MTNEELVLLIKGGEKERMADLWEQNKKLLRKLVSKYRFRAAMLCYDMDDLTQEAYFALERAVNAYNPEKALSFTSYLPFHIKNVMAEMLYTRNGVDKYILAVSTDKTIDEEENIKLIDTIPAPGCLCEDALDSVQNQELQRIIAETLTSDEQKALKLRFSRGLSYPKADVFAQKPTGWTRQQEGKALRKLRAKRHLLDDGIKYTSGAGLFKATHTSPVEAAALKRERQFERLLSNLK